jgi:hypothetical protein
MEQEREQPLPSWLVVRNEDVSLQEHNSSSIVPSSSSDEDGGVERRPLFSFIRQYSVVPFILQIALAFCVILMILNIVLIVKIETDRDELSREWQNMSIEKKILAEKIEQLTLRQNTINETIAREVDRQLQIEKKK